MKHSLINEVIEAKMAQVWFNAHKNIDEADLIWSAVYWAW